MKKLFALLLALMMQTNLMILLRATSSTIIGLGDRSTAPISQIPVTLM